MYTKVYSVFLMKRFIATLVLALGILPSIPVVSTFARVPNQRTLTRDCKDRLGFGQTDPLYGAQVLALRRCIDETKASYSHAEQLLRDAPISHYTSRFTRLQQAVATRRETRRSLNNRMEAQKEIRDSYYSNLTINQRDVALQQHFIERRTESTSPEAYVLRAIRAKQAEWNNAIRSCVFYPRENRQECVYIKLSL